MTMTEPRESYEFYYLMCDWDYSRPMLVPNITEPSQRCFELWLWLHVLLDEFVDPYTTEITVPKGYCLRLGQSPYDSIVQNLWDDVEAIDREARSTDAISDQVPETAFLEPEVDTLVALRDTMVWIKDVGTLFWKMHVLRLIERYGSQAEYLLARYILNCDDTDPHSLARSSLQNVPAIYQTYSRGLKGWSFTFDGSGYRFPPFISNRVPFVDPRSAIPRVDFTPRLQTLHAIRVERLPQ